VVDAGVSWSILFPRSQQTDLFHSLLLVGMSIDAFAAFPTGTVWLGCPYSSAWDSWLWLGIPGHLCTNTTVEQSKMCGYMKRVEPMYT
jgi:hypothetical protein